MARLPLLIREPIKRLERGNSLELARTLDNRASDGKQSVRIALDQRLGCSVALSDPWTFVERAGDLGEWLKVELDDSGAERFNELNVARESSRRIRVIKELALIRAGNAQPKPTRKRRKRRGRERAAVSVLFVESAGLLIDHEGVADIASENRDGVERTAGGNDARRGESAERRLQPNDSVERGRHAPRSRRVGAKRKRDEAGADRGRRAGARSPGMRSARNALRGTP